MSRYASRVLAGTYRGLIVGTEPAFNKENADAAFDQPGFPETPIEPQGSLLESGTTGLPYWDALEDPNAETGLYSSPNPTPWVIDEDRGAQPIVGAYEGAFRTEGPVRMFGHEPSGGLDGDQAIGRIMRFPANKPERYDSTGVVNNDWSNELASAVGNNAQGITTEPDYTESLLMMRGIGQPGWET